MSKQIENLRGNYPGVLAPKGKWISSKNELLDISDGMSKGHIESTIKMLEDMRTNPNYCNSAYEVETKITTYYGEGHLKIGDKIDELKAALKQFN
ncbi:hypothetical protein OB236_14375 [Paenibacillus sp. WQ 127069]|uniref:Uncharacterized protein n=1 Tax=Paenibacillus baimaensis TaxID=2982185 RepID=A0ABT2UI11_9BACL|nr:hypothetical protein [Paenibacillus sp. WQ 127069]MCU6793299.1 hypothetical protein [Paenibacillus sp. WQ 127069]